jgi:hypothetical protein
MAFARMSERARQHVLVREQGFEEFFEAIHDHTEPADLKILETSQQIFRDLKSSGFIYTPPVDAAFYKLYSRAIMELAASTVGPDKAAAVGDKLGELIADFFDTAFALPSMGEGFMTFLTGDYSHPLIIDYEAEDPFVREGRRSAIALLLSSAEPNQIASAIARLSYHRCAAILEWYDEENAVTRAIQDRLAGGG